MNFLIVFIGSGLGGMARYGVGMASVRLFDIGYLAGTLAINIVGSALMGLVVALFPALSSAGQDARLFLTTGIIGGFTTFSTFSLDAAALWERGEQASAVGYVLASVIVSIAALFLTMHLGRRFASPYLS